MAATATLLSPDAGRQFALDLHNFLRDLDPARYRAEGHPGLVERAQQLRERAVRAYEALQALRKEKAAESPPKESLSTIASRLAEVARFIEEHTPRRESPVAEAGPRWQQLRERLVPTYEALAASLRAHRVHVPSLRPTNYARNLFHITSGMMVLISLETWMTEPRQRWVATAAFVWAWSMEIFRRRSSWLNNTLMLGFGKVAHPHEWHRINSGTWYISALLGLAWLSPLPASVVAVGILALADPAAALIGRRFGRIRLVHGRSLEGSLSFVVVGLAVSLSVLHLIHDFSWSASLLVSLAAVLPSALAELFSGRIDDNFTIPATAALGAGLAMAALGL